jgi:uncharacterized membrane protein
MSQESDATPLLPARPFDSGSQRLEFFSDAILAIAITLLVFNIRVHPRHPSGLAHALGQLWPSYLAYALSFCTIGLVWISHHSMFRRIGAVDRPLLMINLSLMAFVAFLPFPTGVLAQYARLGGSPQEYSTMLYALTMTAIGVSFLGLWVYLRSHPHLFLGPVETSSLTRSIRISAVIPVAWAATAALAFVLPDACYVIWFLITVYIGLGPATRRIPVWSPPVDRAPAAD